ncbi:MAG: CtsR family transcriptional regulator [Clostridiales bacterium]|jgi:transcriptional regulator CtsR|nr:CtsR family transcriptional regulator [Clostridiales bacterium]
MTNISDLIEKFILGVIGGSGEIIINRNDLANRFECAYSQINYVLNTRFTVEKGYAIESRRGGGGYIRLFRMCGGDYFKNILDGIKNAPLSYNKCAHIIERMIIDGVLSVKEGEILSSALSAKALCGLKNGGEIRRDILSEVVVKLWKENENGERGEFK